jgi:anthranilate synthase component 2
MITDQPLTAQHSNANIFMLDNQDSFTYNLVDEFKQLGFDPVIYRNTLSADYILQQMQASEKPPLLVLSPGPGDPSGAGCLLALIEKTQGTYPILGICLGHQALVQHYGGKIGPAPEIVHGKSSMIDHNRQGVFSKMTNPLSVARYHSLTASTVPEQLEVIAAYHGQDQQKVVMAVEHKAHRVLGFQFHPESILTTYGSTLLAASINYLLEGNDLPNSPKAQQRPAVTPQGAHNE